jgi:hypothetical protein
MSDAGADIGVRVRRSDGQARKARQRLNRLHLAQRRDNTRKNQDARS